MQRTSATCYFAYNDAAVHANARNHPEDDIKRGPINPLPLPPFLSPEAKSVSRRLSFVPWGKEKIKAGRKERKKYIDRLFFPPCETTVGKNRSRLPCESIISVSGKITSVPLWRDDDPPNVKIVIVIGPGIIDKRNNGRRGVQNGRLVIRGWKIEAKRTTFLMTVVKDKNQGIKR